MNPTNHTDSVIEEHLRECDECAREGLPAALLNEQLRAATVPVDPNLLSRRAWPALGAALAARAADNLRRRAARGVLLSLLPLAAVLAYDVWVLQVLHSFLDSIFPSQLATWIVVNYAAAIVLLLGATYAAIPLLVARQTAPPLEVHR